MKISLTLLKPLRVDMEIFYNNDFVTLLKGEVTKTIELDELLTPVGLLTKKGKVYFEIPYHKTTEMNIRIDTRLRIPTGYSIVNGNGQLLEEGKLKISDIPWRKSIFHHKNTRLVKPTERGDSMMSSQNNVQINNSYVMDIKDSIKAQQHTQKYILKGYSITSQSRDRIILQKVKRQKKKTSHLMHLVLSILTLGIWVIFWALASITNDLSNLSRTDDFVILSIDKLGILTVKKQSKLNLMDNV